MNRPVDTVSEVPQAPAAPSPRPRLRPPERRPPGPRRRRVLSPSELALALGALALAALSLLLPSTPSYDPWAWIIWGREILELDLDTTDGPSWKPLPILFTTPVALAGDAAPELWLVVARAGGLLALAFAWRLASRLAGGGRAGVAAGALAAAGIALTTNWIENAALGYSEGILTALLLLAIDRHLDGREAHAWGLGLAGALLRPEVWPFLGLYGLWMLARRPALRRLVLVSALIVPLLWFVPEWWGSGDPWRASSRAQEAVGASPALTDEPAREVLRRAEAYLPAPVEIGFVVAALLALAARRRSHLALTAATVAWVGLVAVMTSRGYAGNERYLAFPLALGCVVAGVGWARLWADASELLARARPRGSVRAAQTAAAALALALLTAASVAGDVDRKASGLGDDRRALRYQGNLYEELPRAVEQAGGREALLACGQQVAGPYQVPALAWALEEHVGDIHIHETYPGTLVSTRNTQREAYAPPLPDAHSGYDVLASTALWRINGDCAPGASASVPPR